MGGGHHSTTTNNETNDFTVNTKNINDNHTNIENEWNVKNSETNYQKGDKIYGRSADLSNSANGGLRCVGMALSDPRCKMHLQNLVQVEKKHHHKKSHGRKSSLRKMLQNLDSTKTNVHHTSSSETNTVNNIKNILNEHNTYDDVLNGTLVMGNRYLFKNGGNYNTGVQVMRLMQLNDKDHTLMLI